jgi:hypothetical protein
MRQRPPGPAVAIAIEDGVEDPAEAVLAGSAQGLRLGKEGFKDGPPGVGQVLRIGLRFDTASYVRITSLEQIVRPHEIASGGQDRAHGSASEHETIHLDHFASSAERARV